MTLYNEDLLVYSLGPLVKMILYSYLIHQIFITDYINQNICEKWSLLNIYMNFRAVIFGMLFFCFHDSWHVCKFELDQINLYQINQHVIWTHALIGGILFFIISKSYIFFYKAVACSISWSISICLHLNRDLEIVQDLEHQIYKTFNVLTMNIIFKIVNLLES